MSICGVIGVKLEEFERSRRIRWTGRSNWKLNLEFLLQLCGNIENQVCPQIEGRFWELISSYNSWES